MDKKIRKILEKTRYDVYEKSQMKNFDGTGDYDMSIQGDDMSIEGDESFLDSEEELELDDIEKLNLHVMFF